MARFGKLEFDDEDSLESTPSGVVSEKNETHWLRLADANRRTGSHENALRFYSRALEIDRSLIVAWVGQVQMLVMLGEYPQASTWSKKALELYPNNTELLAGQAQAECRLGDFKQANALIDGAMKVRGDSAYNWQVRGELMLALKQKTDRHCFDKAQISSSDSLVPLETAQIYLYYQQFSKGQQRATQAVEKQPDSYFAWFILGTCQENLGLIDAAKRSYRQCIELCPNHQEATVRLTRLESSKWQLGSFLKRLLNRN